MIHRDHDGRRCHRDALAEPGLSRAESASDKQTRSLVHFREHRHSHFKCQGHWN